MKPVPATTPLKREAFTSLKKHPADFYKLKESVNAPTSSVFTISCLALAKCSSIECLCTAQTLNCVRNIMRKGSVIVEKKQSTVPIQDVRFMHYNCIILPKGLPKFLFNYILSSDNNVKLSRNFTI